MKIENVVVSTYVLTYDELWKVKRKNDESERLYDFLFRKMIKELFFDAFYSNTLEMEREDVVSFADLELSTCLVKGHSMHRGCLDAAEKKENLEELCPKIKEVKVRRLVI